MTFIGNRKLEIPISAQELIGRDVIVFLNPGKDLPKVQGKIIDETTNTVIVDVDGKRKVFPKATSVFQINARKVNGKELVGNPEDRTKKFFSMKKK